MRRSKAMQRIRSSSVGRRSVLKGAAAGAAIGGLYEVVTREEEALEVGAITAD